MQVEWSNAALDDQAAIVDYLLFRNPHALKRILERLIDATNDLAVYPYMGREGINDTREWSVINPYIIIYEIDELMDKVKILRIWHMSQNR